MPAINDKVQVLYLANYIDGKGQLHALKALAALKNQPDVKNIAMNFYGGFLGLKKNEEYKESLEKFAMEIGISDKVSFNDKTTAIESVMKAHDVGLNFSESESVSRVTL
ncbi:MAG: glycosyltransferase [Chitinophagaceae bacterium]|nr:glycosyltransferase [Chitinophagaceae bacterium]